MASYEIEIMEEEADERQALKDRIEQLEEALEKGGESIPAAY